MQLLRVILIGLLLLGCAFLSYTYMRRQHHRELTPAQANLALGKAIQLTSKVMSDANHTADTDAEPTDDPVLRRRRGSTLPDNPYIEPVDPAPPDNPSTPPTTQPKQPAHQTEQETIIGLRGGRYEYDPNHPIFRKSTEAYW